MERGAREGWRRLVGNRCAGRGRTLVAVGWNGTVLRSDDGHAAQWSAVRESAGADLLGIAALGDGRTLVAVGANGTVLRSEDGGWNWSSQRTDTHLDLRSVSAIQATSRFVAVGAGALRLLQVAEPATPAVAASQIRLDRNDRQLSLQWRYPSGDNVDCRRVLLRTGGNDDKYDRSVDSAPARVPGTAQPTFSLTWNPETKDFSPPKTFRYDLECVDKGLNVTWRQRLDNNPQYWNPDGPPIVRLMAWFGGLQLEQKMGIGVGAASALWALALASVFFCWPALLVEFHERLPEPQSTDGVRKGLDKLSAGTASVVGLVCRSLLGYLGTSPRALDAWIAKRAGTVRRRFKAQAVVADRLDAVDLPVKLNETVLTQPWNELGRLAGEQVMSLLITGPGGAGKTTLACAIGRRALGDDGRRPLAGRLMLPLLCETDVSEEATKPEGLCSVIAGALRDVIGEPRPISIRLAKALLRKGRVVVIFDGMSERSVTTHTAFDPTRQGFPITHLIVTSREHAYAGIRTVMECQEIPPEALFDFIKRYLATKAHDRSSERQDPDVLFDACADLSRLLRDQPTTPLLATMWGDEITADGKAGHLMIDSVAELMDRYVRRVLRPTAQGNAAMIERLRADAVAIARRELGDNFRPENVTRADALNALRELDVNEPDKRIALLETSRLLEAPSADSDVVHITPDPVAEHIVARSYTEALGSSLADWRGLLAKLRRQNMPVGFLAALRACGRHSSYGRPVPQAIRDVLEKTGSVPDNSAQRDAV